MNKHNERRVAFADDVIKAAELRYFGAVEVEDHVQRGSGRLVGEGAATDNHELQAVATPSPTSTASAPARA